MKLKFAHLIALAGLAVSAPSIAEISNDNWPNLTEGNGSGELFLVAFDEARGQTYVVDLNLTAGSFISNNASLVNTIVTTDSGFQAWLAGSANQSLIQWNLGAIYNQGTWGALVTHGVDPAGAGSTIEGVELPPNGSVVASLVDNMNGFISDANTELGMNTSGIGDGNATWLSGVWGTSYGNLVGYDSTATGFADSLLMSLITADPADFLDGLPIAQAFGAAAWGVDPLTGSVCYGDCGGTTVVPIPAAAWLLGSGLLGLVGVGRRGRREALPVAAAA